MALNPGALRFNNDSLKLELYDGNQWVNIVAVNYDVGISTALSSASNGAGTRGLFAGGYQPATISTIQYINVSSTGNSITFGSLSLDVRRYGGACASSTRAVFAGGANIPGAAGQCNHIEFVTIASTGNTTDFNSDLTVTRRSLTGLSNSTRGIFAGGYTGTSPDFNTIDFITIASTGTIGDFGDLIAPVSTAGSCASSTRGIWAGGRALPSTEQNRIEFVTISTMGNTASFGSLSQTRSQIGGCSNSIRGIFAGGIAPTAINTIDYVTISTLGNAIDFGDLSVSRRTVTAMSSPTRAVFSCGSDASALNNTIDYVTIMTTGNAVDFGDGSPNVTASFGSSNGHGGL